MGQVIDPSQVLPGNTKFVGDLTQRIAWLNDIAPGQRIGLRFVVILPGDHIALCTGICNYRQKVPVCIVTLVIYSLILQHLPGS